jgi:hypothetical protein
MDGFYAHDIFRRDLQMENILHAAGEFDYIQGICLQILDKARSRRNLTASLAQNFSNDLNDPRLCKSIHDLVTNEHCAPGESTSKRNHQHQMSLL